MLGSPALDFKNLAKMYNVTLCIEKSDRICEKNARDESRSVVVSNDDCPLECLSTVYSTSLNSANYPSLAYCKLLQTEKNATDKFTLPQDRNLTFPVNDAAFMQSFLAVSIYFQEPWYTYIETNLLVSAETLIGLVGGILGLAGISLLTVVELFFLTFDFLKILITGKYKKYE